MLNFMTILSFLILPGRRRWRWWCNPNSVEGSLQIDEDVFDPGSLDLNNSIGILNIGSFKTETVKITGHTQNGAADDVITYGYTGGTDADYGTTYKDKHHYYFSKEN